MPTPSTHHSSTSLSCEVRGPSLRSRTSTVRAAAMCTVSLYERDGVVSGSKPTICQAPSTFALPTFWPLRNALPRTSAVYALPGTAWSGNQLSGSPTSMVRSPTWRLPRNSTLPGFTKVSRTVGAFEASCAHTVVVQPERPSQSATSSTVSVSVLPWLVRNTRRSPALGFGARQFVRSTDASAALADSGGTPSGEATPAASSAAARKDMDRRTGPPKAPRTIATAGGLRSALRHAFETARTLPAHAC